MTSYFRETDRYETGLPSIRQSAFHRPRSPHLQTIEDSRTQHAWEEQHHRYSRDRDACHHTRPLSPTGKTCRQTATDSHDQLRFYREELAKKDQLITELTSVDTPRLRVHASSTTAIEDIYSNEKIANHAAIKSENAALSVRCESLSSQVREMRGQMECCEEKIRELKMHLETAKENEAKHRALSQSLREKVITYESEFGNLEDTASRSGVAIQSLQRQNTEAKARILELERRNRELLEEREHVTHCRSSYEQRFTEVIQRFNSVLGMDSSEPELIVSKLTDIMQDNAMMRGKLTTMKEYLSSAEVENKASRETIMRLVTETEREQRNIGRFSLDMDNLKLERDTAMTRQKELEREVGVLRERLDANQRAWNATRSELKKKKVPTATLR